MKPIQQYLDYIRTNPKGYWFKRKLYGWGWVPARWQGWAVIAVFVAVMFANAFRVEHLAMSDNEALQMFLPETAILVALLLLICLLTGEPPKWQWGMPKSEESEKK